MRGKEGERPGVVEERRGICAWRAWIHIRLVWELVMVSQFIASAKASSCTLTQEKPFYDKEPKEEKQNIEQSRDNFHERKWICFSKGSFRFCDKNEMEEDDDDKQQEEETGEGWRGEERRGEERQGMARSGGDEWRGDERRSEER